MENQLPIERYPSWRRKLPYGKIGFGYIVDPDDPYHVIPNPEEIAYIEMAFDYLDNNGASLREVTEWLSQKIKKPMVHQTVNNLYRKYRKPYVETSKKKNGRVPTKHEMRLRQETGAAKKRYQSARAKLDNHIEKRRARQAKKEKPIPLDDYDTPPVQKERPKNLPHLREYTLPKEEEVNFVFKPNPGPQSDFLSATELEVLYGGAAGGGKSFAMIADPMRYFNNPNFVGLLLRRTNDELRELKWETQKLYPLCFPGAVWKEKDSMWVFPSGAKFWITYLDRDEDVLRYQGQAFTWIGMDELTQYASSFPYTYLKSRLRTSDPSLKHALAMRATTNPGGPGHAWVKKMFIDPAPAGEAFWATDIETGEILTYPDDHKDPNLRGKPLSKRRFIPARLSDNPYLYDDGIYERNLLSLSEAERKKLLDGDWNIMEGAAFPEFSPKVHVCEPFEIPDSWRKFRAADYGYSSYSAVLWFAIDPEFETLYVYRELYQSKLTGIDLAQKVLWAEREERISYGVLDSSVWHNRGQFGPSIAEEMIGQGCRWRPADRSQGSRTAGKNRLHELLKVNPVNEKPGIIIFNTCRQLLADLPMLPQDPDGLDDIDSRYRSDHTYDALRYGITSRPKPDSHLDWGSKPLNEYKPVDPIFGY